MAAGDHTIVNDLAVGGKIAVTGTADLAGGAKDTTLVTDLNADKVDGADKDTDVDMAANSDAKVPSQKAVKAYIDTKSILESMLTTQGDLAVRGAGDSERLAAGALDTYFKGQGAGVLPIYEKLALKDTGVKIGESTRDAGGDQVITGVGFQPSVVIFVAADAVAANRNWSIGFDDGTIHPRIYQYDNGTAMSWNAVGSISIRRGTMNKITGSISALGADGFTITWDLAGESSAEFIYLALP